ncbi:MAG: class II glutamine amidotransferase, partial [Limnobacter sp.]|nr:class II glutamine amidotransferase [Limnobacter sp.]
QPAYNSPVSELIRAYPIRSYNVISHIRKATEGAIKLANCHPFVRELWGQAWVFAHNGDLKDFHPKLTGDFLPIGETDSERAFCLLLQTMKAQFGNRTKQTAPKVTEIEECLKPMAKQIAEHGTFNMLLSNGQAMYTHCSTKLSYIVREHPFTKAHLIDCDMQVDFGTVTTKNDRVAVIATTPLTDDEVWTHYESGQFTTFHEGEPLKP